MKSEHTDIKNEFVNYGWVCPVCGKSNSPWIEYCIYCHVNTAATNATSAASSATSRLKVQTHPDSTDEHNETQLYYPPNVR